MVRTRWAVLPVLALLVEGLFAAQDRSSLPAPEPFLSQVRAHLQTDRQLLSQYTFHEREAEIHLSKLGKLTTGSVNTYEVYPGLDPDDTYRRLTAVDGKPRDPSALDKEDRTHQKHVLDELNRRAHESAGDRQKRLERDAKEQREVDAWIDDVFRVYRFALVERQQLDGHSTIVVDFAPQPNVVPKTDDGKDLKKVKGRAWISEDDYQVARVDILMLEDLSVKGFLARLYKGTTASYEQRQVNNEVWLPTEIRLNLSGRALIRKFHIETVVQYFDYRKFSVNTNSEFALPPRDGE